MEGRKSNFELLRVLCMFSIVMHHYSVHTLWEDSGFKNENYNLFIRSLGIGGKIAVGIFVLISGYFMAEKKFDMKKNLLKARKLILRTVGYSISIYVVYRLLLSASLVEEVEYSLLSIFFPFTFSAYWFVTEFVIILLLSPFINLLVDVLDQKKHKLLLIISFFCLSVLPTLRIAVGSWGGNSQMWFVFLFFAGSYIKKYDISLNRFICLLMSLSSVIFFILIIRYRISHVVEEPFFRYDTFYQVHTIPSTIATFGVFFFFKDLKLGSISWINKLATTSFSIYIIHDNKLIRPILWQQIVRGELYANSRKLFLNAFLAVFGTFLICIIIDLLKQKVQKMLVRNKSVKKTEEIINDSYTYTEESN